MKQEGTALLVHVIAAGEDCTVLQLGQHLLQQQQPWLDRLKGGLLEWRCRAGG